MLNLTQIRVLQSKLSNANQSDSDRNKSSVKTEGKELQDAPFPFLIYKPGKLYYACFEQKGNYEWQKERKQFTSVRIVGMRKRSGSVSVQCKEWNTFVEERIDSGITKGTTVAARAVNEAKVVPITEVSADDDTRNKTGIKELDRVLGGGIVPGSLVLVGGDPGIGKSTLLLQVCQRMAKQQKILYISGEESQTQIKLRANRMGEFSQNLLLLCETNLGIIRSVIEKEKPELVIIDSIQTMYSEDVNSAPGSVSQVRESTNVFMQLAKGLCIPIFIVGHVTKEGTVAGPRVLEHMVDTVLYFEGDRHASYRILRAVKNRFGSTNEIGVFEMRQNGLVEVENPSEYMLSGKPENASGSVVACSMEGTRPILLEIQALVARTNFGMPRRTAAGIDYNRVNLLMAVLEKRLGMNLGNCDAYVNIAGEIMNIIVGGFCSQHYIIKRCPEN